MSNLTMPQNFVDSVHFPAQSYGSCKIWPSSLKKLKFLRRVNFVLQIAFGMRFCKLVRPAQLQPLTKFQIHCISKLEETPPVKLNLLRSNLEN